jgi:cellulose biosynthesis protein BcsQ
VTEAVRELGEIVSFYSYKGGTGRSMALANVAYLIASDSSYGSKRVLMIDWDLEAPGLERYFSSGTARDEMLRQPGLIDYFTDVLALYRKRQPEGGLPESMANDDSVTAVVEDAAERHPMSAYVRPIPGSRNLFLMHAGRRMGTTDGTEDYWTKVRKFGWEEFYVAFGSFLTRFREQLMLEYDTVLIDSRTGLTDIGGICTRVMPEKLVLVFAPNHQNIDGVIEVAKRSIDYRLSSRDPRGLIVFPWPSRIDATASQLRGVWWHGGEVRGKKVDGYQRRFEEMLKSSYQLDAIDLESYFDAVQIPHDSDYAYGEDIAAALDGTGDRFGIGYACDQFARRLVSLDAPWESYDANSIGTEASTAFISYIREDAQSEAHHLYDSLVDRLGTERVFLDVDRISAGVAFEDVIGRQLADAVVLAVIGPRWLAEIENAVFVSEEIAQALALGRRVIPILVNGATMPTQHQLPPNLRPLAKRQSFVLDNDRWREGIGQLVEVLQSILIVDPSPELPSSSVRASQGSNEAPRRRGFWAWLRSLFRF